MFFAGKCVAKDNFVCCEAFAAFPSGVVTLACFVFRPPLSEESFPFVLLGFRLVCLAHHGGPCSFVRRRERGTQCRLRRIPTVRVITRVFDLEILRVIL